MVSPKQLEFSNHDDVSDDTLSRRKSPRTPSSKRSASDEPEAEEKPKRVKKKRNIKEEKLASPVSNRIWSREDEVLVLKDLASLKAETGFDSKVEWEAFYPFVDGSIVAKFSKEQVLGKIRKLKRRFLDYCENIKQGNDVHSSMFSNPEVFKLALMSWGEIEAENHQEMLENEEPVEDNGAENNEVAENGEENNEVAENGEENNEVAENGEENNELAENGEENNEVGDAELLTDNGTVILTETATALKAQQNENEEVLLEEHNEEANEIEMTTKELDDGATKAMEQVIVGKESNDCDDELCAVKDAFESLISCDLSEHRKRVGVERLKNLGSDIRRELSDEWKSIYAEERKLKVKKLRYSAKLTEATREL